VNALTRERSSVNASTGWNYVRVRRYPADTPPPSVARPETSGFSHSWIRAWRSVGSKPGILGTRPCKGVGGPPLSDCAIVLATWLPGGRFVSLTAAPPQSSPVLRRRMGRPPRTVLNGLAPVVAGSNPAHPTIRRSGGRRTWVHRGRPGLHRVRPQAHEPQCHDEGANQPEVAEHPLNDSLHGAAARPTIRPAPKAKKITTIRMPATAGVARRRPPSSFAVGSRPGSNRPRRAEREKDPMVGEGSVSSPVRIVTERSRATGACRPQSGTMGRPVWREGATLAEPSGKENAGGAEVGVLHPADARSIASALTTGR
jgi:hypothetical protein